MNVADVDAQKAVKRGWRHSLQFFSIGNNKVQDTPTVAKKEKLTHGDCDTLSKVALVAQAKMDDTIRENEQLLQENISYKANIEQLELKVKKVKSLLVESDKKNLDQVEQIAEALKEKQEAEEKLAALKKKYQEDIYAILDDVAKGQQFMVTYKPVNPTV